MQSDKITDGILLPYQQRWLADESAVRLWEKSRRVGASYVEALCSVLYAALEKKDGGTNTYYLSYNKEMTQQFIKDCAFWAEKINGVVAVIDEVIIKDEGKDITVYRIRFDSGHEIWGLPSKAHSLRSKQGRVVIDEAAFCEDLPELLKAAFALLMWGGSVTVLSTHNGDDNPFNDLIKEIREGKKDYSLHRTTLTDALTDGLYKRILQTQKKVWTQEKENTWREQLIKDYGEGADEELFCIPATSGEKYFTRTLLDRCADKEIPVFRFAADDAFTFEKECKRSQKISDWFTEVEPVLIALKNRCTLGSDFARSGDLTVYWLVEQLPGGDTKTVCVIELRNVPFMSQWQFIFLLVEALEKNFDGAAFDSRGNGQMIAEMAAQEWPGMVFQVMLSRKWYAENFPQLKARIEEQTMSIPDDTDIKNDFGAVRYHQGIPLISERTGDAKSKRHGDGAVAACLADFAMRESEGGAYQPMTYEAVGTPNRFRVQRSDSWDD